MQKVQLLLLAAIIVLLGLIERDLHRLAWEFGPFGAVSNGILGAGVALYKESERRVNEKERSRRELQQTADEYTRHGQSKGRGATVPAPAKNPTRAEPPR